MRDLKLIYDFANRSPEWITSLLPLLFIAITGGIFYYHFKVIKEKNETQRDLNKKAFITFSKIGFVAFLVLFVLSIASSQMNGYAQTKSIYKAKEYKIIEGRVAHFHAMPASGHDSERFDVNGIPFSYSDYDLTDFGYNNAASNGGVIKFGLFVRISYFNNGRKNVILRLETE